MLSAKESMILKQWLASQASPHTRSCYQRDADRLLAHVGKPLSRVTLATSRASTTRWWPPDWLPCRGYAPWPR